MRRSNWLLVLTGVLLTITGCARTTSGQITLFPSWWPREEHGGLSGVKPASDLYFIGAGAVFDTGLKLAGVKPLPRFLADATAAVLLRTWKPLGRTEASHMLFGFGVGITTIADMFIHKGLR